MANLDAKCRYNVSMTNNARLTEYLRHEIKARNLSQREAAERCRVAHTTFTSIYNNRASPTPYTLRAIADGLGLDYELMLQLAGYVDAPPAGEDSRFSRVRHVYEQLDEQRRRELSVIADALLAAQRIDAKEKR